MVMGTSQSICIPSAISLLSGLPVAAVVLMLPRCFRLLCVVLAASVGTLRRADGELVHPANRTRLQSATSVRCADGRDLLPVRCGGARPARPPVGPVGSRGPARCVELHRRGGSRRGGPSG